MSTPVGCITPGTVVPDYQCRIVYWDPKTGVETPPDPRTIYVTGWEGGPVAKEKQPSKTVKREELNHQISVSEIWRDRYYREAGERENVRRVLSAENESLRTENRSLNAIIDKLHSQLAEVTAREQRKLRTAADAATSLGALIEGMADHEK